MHAHISEHDGHYVIFPEGGAWEYRRIRAGRIAGLTSEANLASHVAGRDHLAWLGDVDFDALDPITDDAACLAILAACGYSGSPQCYVICRVER